MGHITVSLASLMHWNCVQHGPDPACVELHRTLECQLDLLFDPGESEKQQRDFNERDEDFGVLG